jgi:hypothetical protein
VATVAPALMSYANQLFAGMKMFGIAIANAKNQKERKNENNYKAKKIGLG